jgi:hypothetical protein
MLDEPLPRCNSRAAAAAEQEQQQPTQSNAVVVEMHPFDGIHNGRCKRQLTAALCNETFALSAFFKRLLSALPPPMLCCLAAANE